jgi:formylglycine-generating enzyme required for sulfatase activity
LVHIKSFWIDATEVTNRQFREFVKATGYQTTAERAQPKGALVFNAENNHHSNLYWWKFIPSADWQHPFGPGSNIDTLDNYPVVQVSWFDAMAYASWAGKRLPTEAEWEYAARAGLTESLYPWGNQSPELNNMANVFQGSFPEKNTAADGFLFTSPVKTFPPNAYGLFDVSGNVWEWCADKYHSEYYKYCSENAIQSPTGPAQSFSPENRYEELRVIRGGSFLCNQSYCTGYRVSARNKTTPSTSLLNVGFRCVRDIPHK